jgi:hypothetical protein
LFRGAIVSAQPQPENRRKTRRTAFDGEARIYSDRAVWNSQIVDISLRGALLARPDGWEGTTGKLQRLELRIATGVIISVNAQVAHVGARVVGYQFGRIDLDSFVRLRRLMELNLGDPSLLVRELPELIATSGR